MMNKELATYLFFNETIYLPEDKSKSNGFEAKSDVLLFSRPLSASQQVMLEKIATAIKLPFSEIQFIEQPIDFQVIKETEKVKKVLLFGFSAKEIGISSPIETYQFIENNGIQVLQAEGFDVIEKNENKEKVLLWQTLQKMFL